MQENNYGYQVFSGTDAARFGPVKDGDEFYDVTRKCWSPLVANPGGYAASFMQDGTRYRRRVDVCAGAAAGSWRLVAWNEPLAAGDETLHREGKWREVVMWECRTPESRGDVAVRRRVQSAAAPSETVFVSQQAAEASLLNKPVAATGSDHCCLCRCDASCTKEELLVRFKGSVMHVGCVDDLFLSLPPRKEPQQCGEWVEWSKEKPRIDILVGLGVDQFTPTDKIIVQATNGNLCLMPLSTVERWTEVLRWFKYYRWPEPPPLPDQDEAAFVAWRDEFRQTNSVGPEGSSAWKAALAHARKGGAK